MPDQLNLRVIRFKSVFLWYILIVYLSYTNDCVAAPNVARFNTVTTRSGPSRIRFT